MYSENWLIFKEEMSDKIQLNGLWYRSHRLHSILAHGVFQNMYFVINYSFM